MGPITLPIVLKTVLLNTLDTFGLTGDRLIARTWPNDNVNFMNFCLDHGHVKDEDCIKVINKRLGILGRESYIEHVSHSVPPDHTTSPAALAFAIRKEVLTNDEVHEIEFDHGENRYTFMAGSENHLTKNVFKQLTTVMLPR